MGSWGLEVELLSNCIKLEVTHLQFVQNEQTTILPLLKPVNIGYFTSEEKHGLETLAQICLKHLHSEYDTLKRKQKITNVNEFLSLYKSEIFFTRAQNANYLLPEIFQEDLFLNNFYLSGDHYTSRNTHGPDQYTQMVIPELIIYPIGRYHRRVTQQQSTDFVKFFFSMALHLSQLNPQRDAFSLISTNVQLKHYGLSELCEQDVFLFGKLTIAKPLIDKYTNQSFFSPQITTVIDLTHFTHHISNGLPTIREGWIFTSITNKNDFLIRFLFELLPAKSAQYECSLIFLARKILALTTASRKEGLAAPAAAAGSVYPDATHYPWIEGAIGFGLVYLFTLLIGIRNPGRTINKNLFHLFPKTGCSTILKEATRAALDYYPALIDHLGTVLFNIFQNPQINPLTRQKDLNGITYLGMINDTLLDSDSILARLQLDSDIIDPALAQEFKCDFLSFWDKGLFIPRIIHAYFLSFLPKQSTYVQLVAKHRATLWQVDSVNDSQLGKQLHDYMKFAQELFTQEDRISTLSQPGFGRPKFELRGLTPFTKDTVVSDQWINQVTEISNGLGQSAVRVPPSSQTQISSIDQTSTIGQSDYQSYLDEYPTSPNTRNPVWFPGQPTHEFGRRRENGKAASFSVGHKRGRKR